MQQTIERELAKLGGMTACVVLRIVERTAQTLVSINPNLLFRSASLIKVPIMVEVARQVAEGKLAWYERREVAQAEGVGGSGILRAFSRELRPTIEDLTYLMIAISDNTASNVLLKRVGIEAVNTTMRRLGLRRSRIERLFMDYGAREAGLENRTTAGDMATLFAEIWLQKQMYREKMLAILLEQNDYTILPAYWGENVQFAHKTGGLEGLIHDAGILYPSDRHPDPLVIVVMTEQQQDEPLTRYTLSRIGRIIYEQ